MKENTGSRRYWKSIGIILVVLFIVLIPVFYALEGTASFESPLVLVSLNTLFLCAIPLTISYYAARSYIFTGRFLYLIFGCGFVFGGVSNLLAGWIMPWAGDPGPMITMHDTGSLLAGVFQLVGAHLLFQELVDTPPSRLRLPRYEIVYAGIIVLLSVMAFLAFNEKLPSFFDPISGPTLLRQFVLGGAICLFVITGFLFMRIYATIWLEVILWYGLGLWLVAIGLTCILLQHQIGSALGWLGRIAQYLGNLYFFIVFLKGLMEITASNSEAGVKVGRMLWPGVEQKIKERIVALTRMNEALQKEINERKQTEERLTQSEQRLMLAQRSAGAGVWDWDMISGTLNWSPELFALFGLNPQDSQATFDIWNRVLHPEDIQGASERIDEAVKNRTPLDNVYRIVRPDGQERWINALGNTVYDETGQPVRMAGICTDITERKHAEARIKQLTRLYAVLSLINQTIVRVREQDELFKAICRVVVDSGKFNIAWIGLLEEGKGKIVRVACESGMAGLQLSKSIDIDSPSFENSLIGIAVKEARVVTSDDIQIGRQNRAQKELLASHGIHSQAALPFSFRGKIFGVLNLYSTDVDLFKADEEVKLLNEIGLDISFALDLIGTEMERDRAIEELKKSEHKYSIFFEKSATPTALTQFPENTFVDVNEAFEKLFGYSKGEVVGKTSLELGMVVPEQRAQTVSEVGRRGYHYDAEKQVFNKSGKILSILSNASIVEINEQRFALTTILNITELKAAEEQINKALIEKETLLRELHHRTKNNMSVIIALLDIQASQVDDERLKAVFYETQNRIQSMALVHQKLYDAHDLSNINLKEYINDLVELLMASYTTSRDKISIVSEMEDVFVLIDTAIPCGLILNELISNMLKFAFPAERAGEIKIQLNRIRDSVIRLCVADNGVGVPSGFDFKKKGQMGLQTVFTLVERQLNGQVVFEAGQGVSCEIHFRDDLYKPRV